MEEVPKDSWIIPSQEDPGDGEKWAFFCSGGKILEFWVASTKRDGRIAEELSKLAALLSACFCASLPCDPPGCSLRCRVQVLLKREQHNSYFLLLFDQYSTLLWKALSTVLGTCHVLDVFLQIWQAHNKWMFRARCWVGYYDNSHSQMKKLRLGGVKQLGCCHTAY